MFYQSRYKKYRIILKSGIFKDVNGQVVHIPQEKIQFEDFRYYPKNPDEEKYLDVLSASSPKRDFWKITDEEMKIAEERQKDIEEINKKYTEKMKDIKKVAVPNTDKVKVKRGVSSTGSGVNKEEESDEFGGDNEDG